FSVRSALAGLIAGALLLAVRASSAEEPAETHVESAEAMFVSPANTHGIATHLVLRIVDDATGDPIPGATVALHSQDEQPVTGLVPATRTVVADEDGWVRIRVDDLGWPPEYTGD